MFIGLSPLLLVGLSFFPTSGEKEERASPYPALRMNGKVLDVFENNQVLISVGANQGIRKGMEMDVYRLEPGPRYVGRVEVVEVGTKHAIGRFRGTPGQPKHARENDIAYITYLVYQMPPIPPIPALPRMPVWQQPGGALLDPEGLLKRK